jgi:hypothetical protein
MRIPALRLPAAVTIAILAAACSPAGDAANAPQQPAMALPEGHPPITGQAAAAQGPGGVVLETMDGGGYTYVRLGAGEQDIWVAGPVTALDVGDTVRLSNPMAMGAFTSQALGRSFDNLYFADGFVLPGAAAASGPIPAGAMQGVVEETMDAGGYTYVRVTVGSAERWLAGPQTRVEQGQTVAWSDGMLMRGFESKTLERTFEQILFVGSLEVVAGG